MKTWLFSNLCSSSIFGTANIAKYGIKLAQINGNRSVNGNRNGNATKTCKLDKMVASLCKLCLYIYLCLDNHGQK